MVFCKNSRTRRITLPSTGRQERATRSRILVYLGMFRCLFSAAFNSPTSPNFSNGTFITYLNNGAVGTMANTLAGTGGNINLFCNMVGSAAFPACASKGTFPGHGYPINFWQVNPYAAGRNVNYLDAAGSSNYNAMQVEFRQRPTHGMEFNINYTWSHS